MIDFLEAVGRWCFRNPLLVMALAAIALLSSCSANTPPPAVEIRTVEVVKEVQRPCTVTIPVRPAKLGTLPTDAIALAAVLGSKLAEYAGPGAFADRALSALNICTKDVK